MSMQYTTKNFFRRSPNYLLARYFHERGLFLDLDIAAMKPTKTEKLFDAWLSLGEIEKNKIEAAFREIHEMSTQKGTLAILDEAKHHLRNNPDELRSFTQILSDLPSFHEKAMMTYMDYPNFWKGAVLFYHADTLSISYWRKRNKLGHKPAALDEESIRQFGNMIRDYFRYTEGRGNNCIVEVYRRDELIYFFAYPEDHSQQHLEWENNEFINRSHTPAFMIVFVYSQKNGSLDINYQGSKNAIEPLQHIFAQTILKIDNLPSDPKDDKVYDLNQLKSEDFEFLCEVSSDIKCVEVKSMRLSSKVIKGDQLILKTDVVINPKGIYRQLAKLQNLELYNVTQVELTALMTTDPHKPAKKRLIRITYPNSCSLKYDEHDLKLRYMLEASGIEFKIPESLEPA